MVDTSSSIFDDDCSPLEDGIDRLINSARAAGEGTLQSSEEVVPYLLHLVQEALSHPRIYVGFYELKAACMESSSSSQSFPLDAQRTLDLFAQGTYMDYYRNTTYYLPLTANQIFKLQQLSIVSTILHHISMNKQVQGQTNELAGSLNIVPYYVLQKAVFIDNSSNEDKQLKLPFGENRQQLRQLEQMLVFLIQNSIVCGKMDQKEKCLILIPNETIGYCISRDVDLKECDSMIDKLQAFQRGTNSLIQTVNQQMEEVKRNNNNAAKSWKLVDQYIDKINSSANAAGKKQQDKLPSLVGSLPSQLAEEYGLSDAAAAASSRRSKRSRGGPIIADLPDAE